MARVRCIMMQKDEQLLLGSWIAYYGYQFGIENLTIFDNGSSSPAVISTLRRLEHAGGHVIWHHASVEDWLNKGKLVEYIVRGWDKKHVEYDFVIPIDCDEFLALYNDSGLTCRRTDLHAYLDGLAAMRGIFTIPSWAFNVPGRPGWFYSEGTQKRFFAAGTLDWVDHGYHNGRVRGSDQHHYTPLTFLHLHNKPFSVIREHSRRKLASFVDVNDPEALRNYRGDNDHVTRNLLIDAAEYEKQFDEKLQFEFAGLADLLSLLGQEPAMTTPVESGSREKRAGVRVRLPAPSHEIIEFNPQHYLSQNIDVAGTDHSGLDHFMLTGYAEGRRFRPGGPGAPWHSSP